jgi:uncharacterized protein DUF5317
MVALVFPALLALLIALALGGSTRGFAQTRLRWPVLLVAPFPLLLLLYNPPLESQPWLIAWGPRIWQLSQLVLLAGLVRNMLARSGSQRIPWAMAATGVALNALVIVANGGYMPVSPDAPAWVLEKATASGGVERLHNTIVMTASTQLNWLGDVLLQPAWLPPRPNVVSVGDVLLSIGVAGWVFATTLSTRKSAIPAPLPASI